MVFRRNGRLDVLEIFPPNDNPPFFCHLSKIYGFGYDQIVGRDSANSTRSADFIVDPDFLAARMSDMISQAAT
jgi:hypothetical protein